MSEPKPPEEAEPALALPSVPETLPREVLMVRLIAVVIGGLMGGVIAGWVWWMARGDGWAIAVLLLGSLGGPALGLWLGLGTWGASGIRQLGPSPLLRAIGKKLDFIEKLLRDKGWIGLVVLAAGGATIGLMYGRDLKQSMFAAIVGGLSGLFLGLYLLVVLAMIAGTVVYWIQARRFGKENE